jgi:hypothetical protein
METEQITQSNSLAKVEVQIFESARIQTFLALSKSGCLFSSLRERLEIFRGAFSLRALSFFASNSPQGASACDLHMNATLRLYIWAHTSHAAATAPD